MSTDPDGEVKDVSGGEATSGRVSLGVDPYVAPPQIDVRVYALDNSPVTFNVSPEDPVFVLSSMMSEYYKRKEPSIVIEPHRFKWLSEDEIIEPAIPISLFLTRYCKGKYYSIHCYINNARDISDYAALSKTTVNTMAITLMYPWGPELHACSVDDALDGDGFGDSDFLDQGGRWVLNGKIIRARSLGLAGVRDGDTLIGQLSKEGLAGLNKKLEEYIPEGEGHYVGMHVQEGEIRTSEDLKDVFKQAQRMIAPEKFIVSGDGTRVSLDGSIGDDVIARLLEAIESKLEYASPVQE